MLGIGRELKRVLTTFDCHSGPIDIVINTLNFFSFLNFQCISFPGIHPYKNDGVIVATFKASLGLSSRVINLKNVLVTQIN